MDRFEIPVSLVLLVLLWNNVSSHTLGEHGLTGVDPTGYPSLPNIQGPFEVRLNVKFESLRPSSTYYGYQTIFEWNDDEGDNGIWFGQHARSDELALYLTHGNEATYCLRRGADAIEANSFFKVSFGVSADDKAWIKKNGVVIAECTNAVVPQPDASHPHRLLGQGSGHLAVDPLVGAISGVEVITNTSTGNLRKSKSRIYEQMALLNLPGQMFGDGFVASFYVRFDDLGRSYQRIFDFGNGSGVDNVWCGQEGVGSNMACELFQDGSSNRIVAPGSIVQGEFAFWHFGVEADGRFWIEKDGQVLASESKNVLPTNVFRRELKFAESHWSADDALRGVVLGLRVDSMRRS